MFENLNLDTSLGQSGDTLRFYSFNNDIQVEKISSESNSRLKIQAKKQEEFISVPGISSPKILKPWDGKSFVMEYVPGEVLGSFLKKASIREVKKISEQINYYLDDRFKRKEFSAFKISQNKNFVKKLEKFRVIFDERYPPIVKQILNLIESSSDFINLKFGLNHGDFSFENILIGKNASKIWLIDFLDSPFDTTLLDVSRILLDLEHGWWKSGIYPTASEIANGEVISKGIRQTSKMNNTDDLEISFFKCFTALRILPYTTNSIRLAKIFDVFESEIKFLKEVLNQ